MSTTPPYNQYKTLVVGIVIEAAAIIATCVLLRYGNLEGALLNACVALFFPWFLAPDNIKLYISGVGVVAIPAFGVLIVCFEGQSTIGWLIAKIAFVFFFGVFVSDVLERAKKISVNHQLVYAGLLMLGALAIKLFISPNAEEGTMYGVGDLLEDLSLGMAGALVGEVSKWSWTPPPSPPPSP